MHKPFKIDSQTINITDFPKGTNNELSKNALGFGFPKPTYILTILPHRPSQNRIFAPIPDAGRKYAIHANRREYKRKACNRLPVTSIPAASAESGNGTSAVTQK